MYLQIGSFQIGLDVRKSPVTAPANSLRVLTNAVINAGAEIEKRKAFVPWTTVPGTIGLAGIGLNWAVFNPTATPGAPTVLAPHIVRYDLSSPPAAVTRLRSFQRWASTFAALFADAAGVTYYNYNGAWITAASGQRSIRTFQTKMYAVEGPLFQFSAINDPAVWLPATGNGAGFIDVSQADSFTTDIIGIERFYKQLALFGRNAIQLWDVDPDPAKASLSQSISNTGLIATNALGQFANGDVLYLAQTGIRSMRARDASNFAIQSDVGSPIDTLITNAVVNKTDLQLQNISACIDPQTGAFWMAIDRTIYVLSFYPTSKISAWSMFTVPFDIDYMAANDVTVAIRSGDQIYLYGGDFNQNVYDDSEVVVQTPFLDAGDPAANKQFKAIDAALEGTWTFSYNLNPRIPSAWQLTSTLTAETYTLGSIGMLGQSTHIAFEIRTTSAMQAKIGALTVHFEGKLSS